jgi:hypothetical protein
VQSNLFAKYNVSDATQGPPTPGEHHVLDLSGSPGDSWKARAWTVTAEVDDEAVDERW